ncbi:MAG: PDR/VanB family oxidoreductase, partial [Alphaproteobacteria bacterium]|nr:PDR/VanB family oxidoreductase [Alphaproteobacteria bacterium]
MTDLRLKATDIEALTPSIKSFRLVAEDGGPLPAWEAGAHVVFALDVEAGDLRKSYSLAGDPTDRGSYMTAILREEGGEGGSKYMHDQVKVGDVLTTTEPQNNFPLAKNAKKHLLIAGGIGITPILAMGRTLRAQGADFHLHYCTKAREDTAFVAEVEEIFRDGLTFHHDGGDPTKGIKLGQVLAEQEPGTNLYICGPTGLLSAAREAAGHWAEGTVHFELFSSARTQQEKQAIAEAAGGDETFEVVLKQSNTTLTVPPDRSIFEVLRENGVNLPSACEE